MTKQYNVPIPFVKKAYINEARYKKMYQQSIEQTETFWGDSAKEFISWHTPFETVKRGGFEKVDMRWFIGGKLNASYNCLDRHLKNNGEKTAIIWEGDNPHETKKISYQELHNTVCRFANTLKSLDVKKGDRVCIYLPMIPEVAVAMLACARIGAIHMVVFGGFSSDSLKTRILDADCKLVITADEGIRGGKIVSLKKNVDDALKNCPNVKNVVVVKRTGNPIQWQKKRDVWYHEAIAVMSAHCEPERMDSEDPLFILHTSGSTGRPKGILHTTGGYLVYVAMTHKYIFDYHEEDIFWCTADVGWITGHSYIIYGPLANAATTVMFEGVPHYPSFSRYWEIVDKHKVSIFYTAPTAIRSLRREGDSFVTKTSRKTLKLLATVGEPINPEVWEWYYQVVGEGRCPIVDTWWQTETGGILISPLPGASPLKPGSATWPFFGIEPMIVDESGKPTNGTGKLVIKNAWPGFMKTIYGDHQRFIDTYFKEVTGVYLTGDSAHCDEEGYYWISGRMDDVIKISGHRLGTEELESALLEHPAVSEAAVVSVPDDITGEAIYAYVTTKANIEPSDNLKQALKIQVRKSIGPIATPKEIQWAAELPKTRSGKIMRRLLRKIARNDIENLGDVSTLSNPSIVKDLISSSRNLK